MDTEIESIDAEIEKVIISNEDMKENYELATSIKGIGPVIATDLIIKTGNFKAIDMARKAVSYAGGLSISQFVRQNGWESQNKPLCGQKT